jgi:hypothetical protein
MAPMQPMPAASKGGDTYRRNHCIAIAMLCIAFAGLVIKIIEVARK